MSINYHAQPTVLLQGEVRVPGDKSISHRSVMLGSLADGITKVSGFLNGEDAIATINAFRQMGVKIEHTEDNLLIHGVGREGLNAPKKEIDLGNSGTAMRLMMGLLAGQNFDAKLSGDASLCSRPMRRISDPLALMGAKIESEDGRAPLTIKGGQALNGIDYSLPMASAQVKSAVLLAGIYAQNKTCVLEPSPTRDHTERMLRGFGYEVNTEGNHICLEGGGSLTACTIDVPADISSAAFFIVAASISLGSDIILKHVGVNPTRTGVIDIMQKMGANIRIFNERSVGGEPVADIQIKGSNLSGIAIPKALVPLAIDEIPVIAIAAACAHGVTRLSGAEELRVKESDRIMAVVNTLQALGVDAQETPDGFIVQGKGRGKGSGSAKREPGQDAAIFSAGKVQSFDDHRIAMAASVASLRASGEIMVEDCDNVATSFPNFIRLANSLGMRLQSKAV